MADAIVLCLPTFPRSAWERGVGGSGPFCHSTIMGINPPLRKAFSCAGTISGLDKRSERRYNICKMSGRPPDSRSFTIRYPSQIARLASRPVSPYVHRIALDDTGLRTGLTPVTHWIPCPVRPVPQQSRTAESPASRTLIDFARANNSPPGAKPPTSQLPELSRLVSRGIRWTAEFLSPGPPMYNFRPRAKNSRS